MRVSVVGSMLVLSLLGCGSKAKSPAAGGGAQAGGAAPSMPVEVAAARTQTVVDAISATGQIEAVQAIDLRPDVAGRLVEIVVQEGAAVRAGQPLFKVDDAELKAQVARAEADRDLSNQALTRTRELIAKNASSAADLEQAEATSKGKGAELDLLKLRLERTVVRAPFDGVAGRRYVSLGDYVTSSDKLVSLQTVDPERAAFAVPERYARRLRVGQKVQFVVAAIAGQTFTGTVDFVDPVVQLPARTILVKALVPNPQRHLQAGMFVEASLQAEVRANAVVIPEDAIVPLSGSTFVWLAKEGKAVKRTVQLGVRTEGFVEIASGVAAGDQVVVGGQERLFEGAGVTPKLVERVAPAGKTP
ncbi:MAG: efflux RND transporter periplasmic adaptor subunit [Gemmatimonadota bacterium]